jgi:RPA family protein
MEGAGRIFAGEYCRARNVRADFAGENPALLTPGGMVCHLLFVAGTLTEKEQKSRDHFYGRVADPTGVFEIRKMRPDAGIQAAISGIDIPAFVTVMGQARVTVNGANPAPFIELLELREVDRMIRDAWIVRTAELTCARLSLMKEAIRSGTGSDQFVRAISEFHISSPLIGTLAEMVCTALDQVADTSAAEGMNAGIKEKVLSIIRESAGKKGILIDELIELAGKSGIDETAVRKTVRTLLEEDECYQPARDVYKPL